MNMVMACRSSSTSISPFIFTFFFVSFILFIFTTTQVVAASDDVKDYMSKLLKALTPTPPGWSNNTHFCKWKGIVCNEFTSRVHSINLPSMSLTGILPLNLNTLTNLTHLDLHNNSLTGPLPFLAGLDVLETVNLGHNDFTSTPDGCFGYLSALRTLNLSNNLDLTPGTFPMELSESSSLQTLDFEATNIMGLLPPEMFDWFPSLEIVFLSHNNLTGSLPDSIRRSRVSYLRLDNQGIWYRFSGTINFLSSMRFLSQAWLQNNSFTGPIPDLSNCTNLFDLQLESNLLTGVVPPSLMALSSLKNVSLDLNSMQGPVPVFGKGMKATMEGNNFCRSDVGPCDPRVTILIEVSAGFGYPEKLAGSWTGNNPCLLEWDFIRCEGEKIVTVDLGYQNLGGTISPAFANLTGLVNLILHANNLTGSIPHILTTLPQLQLLDVSDNKLSGKIPKFPPIVELITTDNAFLRDASTGDQSHATLLRLILITGVPVFSVAVVILIVIIYKRKRMFRKTRTLLDDNVEDFIKSYNLSVPKRYSYSEVKRITNLFKDKLGQGGYGVVYKANFSDGRQVAVKLINESKGNGEEFINEVASISRTSHVNIVSLLGFCYEKHKRALIYEFMPNGSLDKFIYRREFPSAICNLEWSTLYQIAMGIARGLEYLHQGCSSRILHLDIKPQNILLDEYFCPKISDFGLSEICQRKDSIVSILGTRGTIGFIAPEVFNRAFGRVSDKSDVYSYGMLILEMIGGRKNYDTGGSYTTETYFSDWVYKNLELNDNFANCLSDEEKDMIQKITMVSLWCIQTNPLDRPSMSKVIEMLQGPLESVSCPPKPVLYSPNNMASSQSSYVSSSNLLETNSITLHTSSATI